VRSKRPSSPVVTASPASQPLAPAVTYTVVNAAMSAALPVRIAGTCCSAGFLP
jgi:hypothetical protein